MLTVWVFLVLTNGYMLEVGKFQNEENCETTRKEVIVQRSTIGYGSNSTLKDTYLLTRYFETTKCFQVWK